eukprot:gene23471-biopygen11140
MDDLKFRDVEKKRLRYKFVRTRDELQSMTFTIASMMVHDEGVVAIVVICNPKSDRYNVTIPKALKLYDIVGSTLTVRPRRRRAAVYTSQTLAFSSSRSQSQMVVNAGDYVVQETDGVGYYIVNKETFEDTYEFVPDNIPTMLAGFLAKTLCLRNTANSKVVRKSFTVICEMLVDRGETLSIEETTPIALDLHARAVTPSSGGVFHVDLPGDCGYRVIYRLNQTFKLPDFNISRHELVPRHEPIRDEHVIEQLVARYRVKSRYHFPIIACSDPMVRYLDLRPSHLVRIVRFSPDVGMYAPYRCCAVANTHTTAPPEETLKNS